MKTKEDKPYLEIAPLKLTAAQKLYVGLKVVIDFFIGLIGVIVFAIPMLIIAIAIKLDSPGPVLLKQKRIGYKNKDFTLYKFRSMNNNCNHYVAKNEYQNEAKSQITRVGRILRKTSLDELPQFFNLLTGKMSLIGYRPGMRTEPEMHNARVAFNLFETRPGITGWAQINGRDALAANPTLKVQYDAYYMKHISPWLDIKIFFITIVKVLRADDIVENNNVRSKKV